METCYYCNDVKGGIKTKEELFICGECKQFTCIKTTSLFKHCKCHCKVCKSRCAKGPKFTDTSVNIKFCPKC